LARSTINKREILKKHKDFWIISEGRDSAIAGNVIEDEGVSGPVKEYYLSGIGRYLLNPKTIEVRKKLIGCEIHYKQRGLKKIHHFFRRFLPMGSKRKQKMAYSPEVILSRYKLRIPHLQDSRGGRQPGRRTGAFLPPVRARAPDAAAVHFCPDAYFRGPGKDSLGCGLPLDYGT